MLRTWTRRMGSNGECENRSIFWLHACLINLKMYSLSFQGLGGENEEKTSKQLENRNFLHDTQHQIAKYQTLVLQMNQRSMTTRNNMSRKKANMRKQESMVKKSNMNDKPKMKSNAKRRKNSNKRRQPASKSPSGQKQSERLPSFAERLQALQAQVSTDTDLYHFVAQLCATAHFVQSTHTGLSKRNGAKLRESFCPAAASHSRPRQAGA